MLAAAHLSPASPATPEPSFETLKALTGTWTIQSAGKTLPIAMTYTPGSKGSVIEEHFGKELSVFYQDGSSLLMTHFCNAGNAPHVKLQENSRPGLLEFDMFDITNLNNADAAHVQQIIYRMVESNEFALEIVWQERHAQTSEKYTLTRAR